MNFYSSHLKLRGCALVLALIVAIVCVSMVIHCIRVFMGGGTPDQEPSVEPESTLQIDESLLPEPVFPMEKTTNDLDHVLVT